MSTVLISFLPIINNPFALSQIQSTALYMEDSRRPNIGEATTEDILTIGMENQYIRSTLMTKDQFYVNITIYKNMKMTRSVVPDHR